MSNNDEARMTFTEHLGELRTRIIRAGIAVLVGFVVCYIFSNQIFEILRRPLMQLETAGVVKYQPDAAEGTAPSAEQGPEKKESRAQWTILNPIEPFLVKVRLAMYIGLVIALPVVVYQLCAFIFPGLTPTERKAARFLLGGCAFFVVFGIAVAYFGVFPLVVPYLSQWAPEGVVIQYRMNETVTMVLLFLAGFAVAFQFPMAVLVLVYLGLLTPATLKQYRRPAIVGLAVIAMILTPPEPISMTIMLVPLVILYEMSIWMSYIVLRRSKPKTSDP